MLSEARVFIPRLVSLPVSVVPLVVGCSVEVRLCWHLELGKKLSFVEFLAWFSKQLDVLECGRVQYSCGSYIPAVPQCGVVALQQSRKGETIIVVPVVG